MHISLLYATCGIWRASSSMATFESIGCTRKGEFDFRFCSVANQRSMDGVHSRSNHAVHFVECVVLFIHSTMFHIIIIYVDLLQAFMSTPAVPYAFGSGTSHAQVELQSVTSYENSESNATRFAGSVTCLLPYSIKLRLRNARAWTEDAR